MSILKHYTINERLVEPKLQEATDRIIDIKMGDYVESKIKPLNTRADNLSSHIKNVGDDISKKQDQIRKDQESLRDNLHVQQLAIASKALAMSGGFEPSQRCGC